MPFLRFTRDKRGYETTSLVHPVRRQGRSRPRILYWFRTPPDVKVGRPALDEDAIRWIEEHNPEIEFDWPKILEAKAPASPPAEDARNRRPRRERPERREPPPPQPQAAAPAALAEAESPMPVEPAATVPDVEEEPVPAEEEVVEAFEQLAHPESELKPSTPGSPLQRTIGREQLMRLRARYAELQARITERGGDAERIEALRTQSEPLNPDTWVTDEDARQGLEGFESRIRDLRAALGLRRRRRSRRGGSRHRREAAPETAAAPEQQREPEPESEPPPDNGDE